MPTDNSSVSHLSKDELFEILNEIDSERQHHRNETIDHSNERVRRQRRSSQVDRF